MIDIGRDLLVRGVAAAKATSTAEARFFLEKFLRMEPPIEARVEAWRYLAEISDSAVEKREYIGRILAFDSTDGFARRALAVLDGRLDPADIVNPDRVAPQSAGEPAAASAKRLACPQCGSGRLVAGSDPQKLVCEHCHYEEPIVRAGVDTSVDDHDFAATMWTAKGHRSAERTLTFACAACGASFLLPPGVQSLTCPFCGSVHVDSEMAPREFIAPEAIVPFGSTAEDVLEMLRSETKMKPSSGPFAVYLPIWMFTFAGRVRWTGYEQQQQGLESRRVHVSGDHTVIEQPSLVCATPQLPEPLQHLVDEFDLSALVPYNPRQLAGRPAATYQITLDEASIHARRKALESLRVEIKEEQSEISGLEMTFGQLGIDTFKLLLLPFWIAQVGRADARRLVFVNGQAGTIGQNARRPGLVSWIAGLGDFLRGDR